MEEDYKNANFMVYKYRYLFVILVGVLVYYVLNKLKYTMNAQILGAIVAGVVTLVGINIYTANEVLKHFSMVKVYSRNLSSADHGIDTGIGIDTGLGEDVSMYEGGNNCMNNRSMNLAGQDMEIVVPENIGQSQLAQAAYASFKSSPGYGPALDVYNSMLQGDANATNTNINLPKGNPGIFQGSIIQGPQSVEAVALARSAPQQADAPTFAFY